MPPTQSQLEKAAQEDPNAPRIKLTQVFRSPAAIIHRENINNDSCRPIIAEWTDPELGTFTLVIQKKQTGNMADNEEFNFTIYDERGNPVTDFLDNSSLKLTALTTINEKHNNGIRVIKDGHTIGINECSLSKLPKDVQSFILHHYGPSISNNGYIYLHELRRNFNTNFTQPQIHRFEQYLIITDSNQQNNLGFIVYDTCDANGNSVHPRLWKRSEGSPDYPAPLKNFISKIFKTISVKHIDLGNNVRAIIKDDQISIIKDADEFSDPVKNVGNNACSSHKDGKHTVYYCTSTEPRELSYVETYKPRHEWKVKIKRFPRGTRYGEVKDLRMDPTENFFLFTCANKLTVVDAEHLEEVSGFPDDIRNFWFDEKGRLQTVDNNGHWVIYETNFRELADQLRDKKKKAEQEEEAKKARELAQKVQITTVFEEEKKEESAEATRKKELAENYREKKHEVEAIFADKLRAAKTAADLVKIRKALTLCKEMFLTEGCSTEIVDYITGTIEQKLKEKEENIVETEILPTIENIRKQLAGQLSVGLISQVRPDIEKIEAAYDRLGDKTKEEVRKLGEEFRKKTAETYRTQGSELERETESIVKKAEAELKAITSKLIFDDWLESTYPQLKSRIGFYWRECPIELDETRKKITEARTRLDALVGEYEQKFTNEYAKIRESAAERTSTMKKMITADIQKFIDRIKAKKLKTRTDLENYMAKSDALKELKQEISLLKNADPAASEELAFTLKVKLANLTTEIEDSSNVEIAETGQQMRRFGNIEFPVWEGEIKSGLGKKTTEIVFAVNEKSKGPGVKAQDIMGDVALLITTSRGKKVQVRLFEGMEMENEWQMGSFTYRGSLIAPSYLSQKEYFEIKKAWADWQKGETSKLRQEDLCRRKELHELYKIYLANRQNPSLDHKGQYSQKLQEYGVWRAKNNIHILRRMERVAGAPEPGYKNGFGLVPERSNHWVIAPEDEKNLEKIAEGFKMQTELQEGCLNLAGHAGTGKDVLIKLFAHLTNRPYFSIDCTKWTTESELSEDITLESVNGASQIVHVPSIILIALRTPGAILYFNEINAMTEQAQIFLHALMDEKRSISLKTRSGKVIKADPTVLIAGSMNPGYPGTFEPQLATRSRFYDIPVHYPELHRPKTANDTMQSEPYSVSEALKVARTTETFKHLTLDSNMERNEFVKLWDRHINKLDNGAPDLTKVQEFDLEVILALVQFAHKLREEFKRTHEKSEFKKGDARNIKNQLTVTHPLTLREMRRCAWLLGKIGNDEKINGNPEQVARDLIKKCYLNHIDKNDERQKIEDAMKSWTSQKRL